MLSLMCHMSHVTCRMSPVTCQLSPVTCHLSVTPTVTATDPSLLTPPLQSVCKDPKTQKKYKTQNKSISPQQTKMA